MAPSQKPAMPSNTPIPLTAKQVQNIIAQTNKQIRTFAGKALQKNYISPSRTSNSPAKNARYNAPRNLRIANQSIKRLKAGKAPLSKHDGLAPTP